MVAIYTIGDHQVGLNTYGPETPLFQFKPSVFSLRINNILLLNASWDWMCASRCGYPFPRSCEISFDHDGMLLVGDYRRRNRITHPVMNGIMKPCVLLFQPVLQLSANGSLTGVSRDDFEYCLANSWPNRNGVGPLFRQFTDRTVQIGPDDPPLEFDSVSHKEASRAIDIATQAYALQNESVANDSYVGHTDYVKSAKANRKEFIRYNCKTMTLLRNMSPEKYARFWSERN
jgi:hypothetical protein